MGAFGARCCSTRCVVLFLCLVRLDFLGECDDRARRLRRFGDFAQQGSVTPLHPAESERGVCRVEGIGGPARALGGIRIGKVAGSELDAVVRLQSYYLEWHNS